MNKYAKTPTVFQMEVTECGAASLAMVFGYFGKFLPLEQMRIETGVSRDGCNAANIMKAAKRYGLECHGYRREPEQLKELTPPCIIHWNFNHFVVFEGMKGKYAYINDPAIRRRKLTWEELNDSFTGIVLTFSKTDAFKKEKKKTTVIEFMRMCLKGQYGVIFKLFYIGLLLVFPGLVLPVLSQVFMDDVLLGGYTDWLTKILVFMGVLVGLKAGLTYYRSLVLQKLCSKMTLISGMKFLSHLFRLPISFFDQRYPGDLVGRMDNNTQVNEFLAGELAETILNILVAIFYLVILFLYSPVMMSIGLVNVLVSLGIIILSNKSMTDKSMQMQMSGGKLYGAICSGINITDTLKASGAENSYISTVLGHQAKSANLEQKMGKFQQIVGAVPKATGEITDAILLMAGGILVIKGELTMGMLVAFNSLFDSFCDPVNRLVGFVQKIQTMKANISRVEDISKYQQDIRYEKREVENVTGKLDGKVELKDISFGYSTLKPALVENFSFKLNPGESIAFVGASGCGKSTVAKLVSGLYQPWSGDVIMGGIPLSRIPKSVINASVATVSQNIVLFSGTIRENLTMWNHAILEADLIAAAKDACIHDVIMQQPGGYDYMLTEGADNLSGGQRQRMEIARALATKPSVLIMDEATSALDPIIEKQILDNIKRRGCTCIIVAHRLSAIRDCNQIVVMKQGKIVETGNHYTLMAKEGYYRTLVQNN